MGSPEPPKVAGESAALTICLTVVRMIPVSSTTPLVPAIAKSRVPVPIDGVFVGRISSLDVSFQALDNTCADARSRRN